MDATSQMTIHVWIVPLHVRLARLNLSPTIVQLHMSYRLINRVFLMDCPSRKMYTNGSKKAIVHREKYVASHSLYTAWLFDVDKQLRQRNCSTTAYGV